MKTYARYFRPAALFLHAVVILVVACERRPAQDLPLLSPEEPRVAELGGGERHGYRLELEAGQIIEVRAEQRGVDLVLALGDSSGHGRSLELDGVTGQGGVEIVRWVAEKSGPVHLELRPQRREARRGSYWLSTTPPRPAGPADRQAFEATLLFAEAERLQRSAATREEALSAYEEAAALWSEVGCPLEEARTLTRLGVALGELEHLDEARATFDEALRLWRRAGDRWGEAAALNFIGFVQSLTGAKPEALETYRRALELRREVGDRQGEGQTLLNFAVTTHDLGDLEEAVRLYEEALALEEEVGDQRVRANLLYSLGNARRQLGDLARALPDLLKALEQAQAIDYLEAEGKAHNSLAILRTVSGDLQQAVKHYRASLAIGRQRGDARHEAKTLTSLGMLYVNLGRGDLARDSLRKAVERSRELDDPEGEADGLVSLALVELRQERLPEARAHLRRALELVEGLGVPSIEAWTRTMHAMLQRAENREEEAAAELERALEIRRQLGDPMLTAEVLGNLAAIDRRAGRCKVAAERLVEALELEASVGDPGQRVWLLQSLAEAERCRGRLETARAHLEEATLLLEGLRSGLRSLDLRASFLARREPVLESMVDLLMELHAEQPEVGHDVAAFEASERGRSRSLLDDIVAEGSWEEGGGPALGKARRIAAEMAALGARLTELGDGVERRRVDRRLAELEEEYRRVEIELTETSPLAARPLSLAEIQGSVLDRQTLLLHYLLGERRSFLWAVDTEGLSSFVLPPAGELEVLVEELHDLVTASLPGTGEEPPDEGRDSAERTLPVVAAELGRLLLGPVADRLGDRRLAVVADGPLHQLPFGLLPDPLNGGEPLLAGREVVPIPSASVLASLRRRPRRPVLERVAVVADPVFGRQDPRVGSFWSPLLQWLDPAPTPVGSAQQAVLRSARDLGFDPLRRLRFSRREDDAIRRLASGRTTVSALDFDASRETIFSPEFASSDVLHFATHAILHPETAGLSGIVLSLVDERGRPQDGYLRLHDIYGLELEAELVVLSACRTALGKEVPGEGPFGLPRAFLSAGARRVVASLWSVEDLATSELMARFYAGLFGKDLTASVALREAQRSLWREGRPPSEWAGFVLLGDWR